MRFFRRIAGFWGFLKGDPHEVNDDEDDIDDHHHHHHQNHNQSHRNRRDDGEENRRKGFSVKVPVPVDRANLGPVLTPSNLGDGGVQGLRWYARRLRIDEDGDVADEFLDEVPQTKVSYSADDRKPLPKYEVKHNTRPAKVRRQMISVDGKIHQSVEYQGRLQWV